MILDIEPLQDDGIQSCISFNVEAVMQWFKCNFELMYIDNYNFTFQDTNEQCNGIWKKGELARKLNYDYLLRPEVYLAEFHGMELKSFKGNGTTVIHEQLLGKYPIIIFYDTYYLPWLEKFYETVHSTHAILVVGKDSENNIYCNDTRPYFVDPIKAGKISKDIFRQGFLNEGIIFEKTELFGQIISFDRVAKTIKSIMEQNKDMLTNLEKFIFYFQHNSVRIEELQAFDGGHGILIRAIRNIIRGRINFCKALIYINTTYKEAQLSKIISQFNELVNEWNKVKQQLYLSSAKNNIDINKQHICKLCYEILKMEEMIYSQLRIIF